MTLAEVDRAIRSKLRVKEMAAKERAVYDYTLANLIGKSISRLYSSNNTMPEIYEVYPNLFKTEDILSKQQEQQDATTAMRFRLFAASHNKKD